MTPSSVKNRPAARRPGPDCRKVALHLSELLDREAPPLLEAWALRHLEECPYCREEAAELKALVDRCRRLKPGRPSAECRQKMLERYRAWKKGRGGKASGAEGG